MVDLIPLLSTILPIIASTLLLLVIAINLYLKIRRKFPISVNCWFCNSWTKVPYDDRNSFNCPLCLQYNGFTKDGDYNKIIPEQHDELMNKSTRIKSNKTVANGLCALCNNNQRLKILQLAHFVPLVEENYDVEIEHFQEQLEKAYKLCKKCDRVLKRTLNQQNAWIFGNRLKNMCHNGISKIADQIRKETRISLFAKANGFLSIILVFAVILTTACTVKTFTRNLATYLPSEYLPIYETLIAAVNTSKIVDLNLPPYFIRSIKIEPYAVICGLGLAFQPLKLLWGHIGPTKVNHLLCWIILFLVSFIRYSKKFSYYSLFIEAFCCIYLLATSFSVDEKPVQKTSGKVMRKIVKNLEYTCTDFSESSDFESISSSSKISSSYLNVPQHNTAGNVLNSSFVSAKSSLMNCAALNKSLDSLHLGLGFKAPKSTSSLASFAMKRPKPVLSPPKFQTVNNSWVAGGFWRDLDGILMPPSQKTNLSRSSSESSGFGSQHNEQFIPKTQYFGEFDKMSFTSEFSRFSPTPTFPFSQGFRKTVFPPNLQQNDLLMRARSPGLMKYYEPYQPIQNWSDKVNLQATQSFKDLSLHSN